MTETLIQAATWIIVIFFGAAAIFGVMGHNTTRIFNDGVKGLARSGGDISADSIMDIYAGAREKTRSQFSSRDLVKIEKMYLWIVAVLAAESDPKLQLPKERLHELQVTASELRTELKLLAASVSSTRTGQ